MEYDLKDFLNAANGIWKPQDPVLHPNSANPSIIMNNSLPAAIQVGMIIDTDPDHPDPYIGPTKIVDPCSSTNVKDWYRGPMPSNARFIVTLPYTGAFVKPIQLDPSHTGDYTFYIDHRFLNKPNRIGNPPASDKGMLIPTDSSKICVGIGSFKGKGGQDGLVIREQYWKMTSESHVLDVGETRTVSIRTQYGVQDTSTDQNTMAASINASASGGWGPIQASISAALNQSSSTTHSITISSNTEKYESFQKENKTGQVMMYFLWQMMDVISIFPDRNQYSNCAAMINMATQPCVLTGYPVPDYLL